MCLWLVGVGALYGFVGLLWWSGLTLVGSRGDAVFGDF